MNRKAYFKSSSDADQQIVGRESLPNMVKATYDQADAPPPLQQLNQFRLDFIIMLTNQLLIMVKDEVYVNKTSIIKEKLLVFKYFINSKNLKR